MLYVFQKSEHDLHIVLNSTMKEKLKKIAKEKKSSLSTLVVFVLKMFFDRSDKRYYFGEEDKNKYPEIEWDTHLHIYITKIDYRYLKKLHADLNFFSIASLVRWLLEEFIKEYEEHGWEWVSKNNIREGNRLFFKILKTKRWWKSRELSHFEGDTEPVLKVIYNSNHQVLGFQTYF